MKILVIFLYALFLLNIASHLYYRCKVHHGEAELYPRKPAQKGEIMTYCLPTVRQDPERAFKFLETNSIYDKKVIRGGITYVSYQNWGFSPQVIAKQIAADIRTHGYKPYIIGIGVGMQIALIAESLLGTDDLKIIAINPVCDKDNLKGDTQIHLFASLPLLEFASSLTGWLAHVKLIKKNHIPRNHPELPIWLIKSRQSIDLYLDQLACIAHNSIEPVGTATKAVVHSYFDEVLDNRGVADSFDFVKDDAHIVVDTTHANTEVGGIIYRDELTPVLEKIYSPSKEKDA